MRADKNFKLPKKYKYLLSTIRDSQQRASWKRLYIDGALAEAEAQRSKYVDIFSKGKGD